MTRRNGRPRTDLELRVTMDGQVIIGPLQAMLLEEIRITGSIAAAQRRLGASYAYVWRLVAAMNAIFSPPLVDPIRGGARGGGAILTAQDTRCWIRSGGWNCWPGPRVVRSCFPSKRLRATLWCSFR